MTFRTGLMIAIIVFAGEGGNLAVTYAMKQLGEIKRFAPRRVASFLGHAFGVKWMWLGVTLMAMSFFALLLVLSWADVSFVVPATALSYIVGALGARFLLKEKVSRRRWAGVALVCLGVALVCVG